MVLNSFYSYNTYPYFYSRGSYFVEAHLTKIPMARTNKPDIKPKRTKKVREGLPRPNSVISPAISVSVLIPQDISTVDKAFDWLVADLVQQEKKLVDSHCYERKSGLTFFLFFALSAVGFAFSQEEDARVGQVSYYLFALLVYFVVFS